jgi:hypothetical protein
MESLNVQVGRVLVFQRLVDYSVILLLRQLIRGQSSKLTYFGKFTRGSIPLEVDIELMSIVYILEPFHQLMTG